MSRIEPLSRAAVPDSVQPVIDFSEQVMGFTANDVLTMARWPELLQAMQPMVGVIYGPGTLDDVPDVVQNSWGVNENFSGYVDCDSRWWTAIDNCEAAGVVLTWSAGNEGPGGTSLRSPADRADSPYNSFSVGSTIATAPFTISDFSSRGPSGCGGAFAMKPEVCAPGSSIESSSSPSSSAVGARRWVTCAHTASSRSCSG